MFQTTSFVVSSLLETELVHDVNRNVGDYLTLFNRKSISLTSKPCRALLGPFQRSDRISWIVFLFMFLRHQPNDRAVVLEPYSTFVAPILLSKRPSSSLLDLWRNLSYSNIELTLWEMDDRL